MWAYFLFSVLFSQLILIIVAWTLFLWKHFPQLWVCSFSVLLLFKIWSIVRKSCNKWNKFLRGNKWLVWFILERSAQVEFWKIINIWIWDWACAIPGKAWRGVCVCVCVCLCVCVFVGVCVPSHLKKDTNTKKKKKKRKESSCCGATGLAASWKRWDMSLIPSQHRGLRIQRCCSCALGLNYGLDLIPGLGTPYAAEQSIKKKKENSKAGDPK